MPGLLSAGSGILLEQQSPSFSISLQASRNAAVGTYGSTNIPGTLSKSAKPSQGISAGGSWNGIEAFGPPPPKKVVATDRYWWLPAMLDGGFFCRVCGVRASAPATWQLAVAEFVAQDPRSVLSPRGLLHASRTDALSPPVHKDVASAGFRSTTGRSSRGGPLPWRRMQDCFHGICEGNGYYPKRRVQKSKEWSHAC